MKTKLLLGALLTLAAAGAMTGCDTVVTGSGNYGGVYVQAWYDVYGNRCGSGTPGAGCNFYSDGSKITAGQDPYSGTAVLDYQTYQYTDSYGYTQYYTGYGWVSPTGILYSDSGYALNSGEDQDSRDVIGDMAAAEQAVVTKVGTDFAAKYALSADTGLHIARTLNDWATLSKKQKRARTDADVADFSTRLYGVNVDKAKSALDAAKKGDQSAVISLNNDVATYWGTSPETSKAILKSWYKDQLSEAGLK